MKTLSNYDVSIPSYALSYLVNNDASGIEEHEVKMIDDYMQQYYDEAEKLSAYVIFDVVSEDGHFSSSPELGLACDVYDCKILICK